MPRAIDLRMGVVTPRTAVVLLSGAGIRYRLDRPLGWQLSGAAGTAGQTATAAIFLDGLVPGTEHELRAGGTGIRFRTPPCAGLVDAAAFGLDPGADNAAALARAVAAVPEGGTLMLPEGTWPSGPVFLKSRMTLHLARGARLLGLPDRGAWSILPARDAKGRMTGTWEGLPAASFAALLTAIDCAGLSITGAGTVDGGADAGDWWSWPKETRDGARRPRTLFALRCQGLGLSGVTVRNSPSWTIHPVQCEAMRVAGITVWNPSDSPNTDGLDPEMCRDLRIEGCLFSVGDDCIAIKAGKRGDGGEADHLAPTEGVTIRNCRMERGHGAVVIGSEMSGGVADVRIEDCEFQGTDRGLRIKTRRGRGGRVERIVLADCEMTGVDTAFAANAHYYCDHDGHSEAVQSRQPAPVTERTPQIADIRIARVGVRDARLAVGAFLGLAEAPITGVAIRDVAYAFDPAAVADVPLMADHVPGMRHTALWAENAEITWRGRMNGVAHAAAESAADDGLMAYFAAFAERFDPYKGGSWCYEDGCIYLGLIALYRATGERPWLDRLRRLVDARIAPDGTIDGYDISEYNIDNVLAGRALFLLADEVGDSRYRKAADLLAVQLRNHPRTASGNYWHKLRYPWQVWLDGLYMGLPFQVEYGLATGQPALVEDAVAQLAGALDRLWRPATRLYAHAWDEKRLQPWADPATGLNPDHWARAVGWLVMALVDVIDLIGAERAAAAGLVAPTRALLARLVELQTARGLWLQVPDRPDLARNYEEMSASAMFAFGLQKAARLGLCGAEACGMPGARAFAALEQVILAAGRTAEGAGFGPMCHVAGLGVFEGRLRDGTADYYLSEKVCDDDPKGVGPMMMAAAEAIRAGRGPAAG